MKAIKFTVIIALIVLAVIGVGSIMGLIPPEIAKDYAVKSTAAITLLGIVVFTIGIVSGRPQPSSSDTTKPGPKF